MTLLTDYKMDSGYTFQKTDEEFIIQLKEWTGDKTITLN